MASQYIASFSDCERCAYCGDLASTRDHVIPEFYCRPTPKFRKRGARRGDWTVPACGECNYALGAEVLLTVPERAAFLHRKLGRRWRSILKLPDWADHEIEETAGRFKTSVQAIPPVKQALQSRLDHLRDVALQHGDYLRPETAE